ncbi:MAG: phosphopantothenoylcysteine decarboxylase [Candidatus Omnitrophica bacterium]|nr:phosphopantothenoylcysteine decarboxylase [Candidatus Omnitrophota bacterium]
MNLRGKKILITAGPTWVPIDKVRVISNISSGYTGRLIAEEAAHKGARVTLVLGPSIAAPLNKVIRIIRFSFFSELKKLLKGELKRTRYDVIIHAAAVSDFMPECRIRNKLNSSNALLLKLVPLEKLVILIRRLAQRSVLVMFKLEPAAGDKSLIKKAKSAAGKAGADIIVANRLKPYRAFIIDNENNRILASSKQDLARKLIKVLMKD